MNTSIRNPTLNRHHIDAIWLIRLRWGAVVGQIVTIVLVHLGMGIALPLLPLAITVGAQVLLNVLCMRWRANKVAFGHNMLAGFMAFDVLLFTAMLYFTGGPFNPFNFLYLVHIALAAVLLPERWAWALIGLSLLCSGGLFLDHQPLAMGHEAHANHNDQAMDLHLIGMWVAFFVAAIFIVSSISRVMRALNQREQELIVAREQTYQAEKFASLATLATGAAHELATPLSTIALVAGELEHELEQKPQYAGLIDDAQLIRSEVARCREILEQLASDAGQTIGDGVALSVPLGEFVHDALERFAQHELVNINIDPANVTVAIKAPGRTFAHALRSVVKNALEASPEGMPVDVQVTFEGDNLTIVIEDQGKGMPPDVLARAREPFFSTKPPGRGMGLGLFVSQQVTEALGGRFELHSSLNHGTRATFELPNRAG